MTFEEFQKSRKLCTGPMEDWEGDASHNEPRFQYWLKSKYDNDRQPVRVAILIGEGVFDTQSSQGYPWLDCFTSLEEAERKLWNFALSEEWGVEGTSEPTRKIVKEGELPLKQPDGTEVDTEELLISIGGLELLNSLWDWGITARHMPDGQVELVGDDEQIINYLKENEP